MVVNKIWVRSFLAIPEIADQEFQELVRYRESGPTAAEIESS